MTQAEALILGMLCYKERHGYELEKYINQNLMRDWSQIGFSSIYSILNKLNKKGLIGYEMKSESEGPKRKVFHLLEEGRELFFEKLLDMLKTPTALKQDIDVGITFIGLLEPEVIKSALQAYKMQVEVSLDMYQSDEVQAFGKDPHVFKLLRRAVLHMEADLKWINEILLDYEN